MSQRNPIRHSQGTAINNPIVKVSPSTLDRERLDCFMAVPLQAATPPAFTWIDFVQNSVSGAKELGFRARRGGPLAPHGQVAI
jgi:hypothetical protein